MLIFFKVHPAIREHNEFSLGATVIPNLAQNLIELLQRDVEPRRSLAIEQSVRRFQEREIVAIRRRGSKAFAKLHVRAPKSLRREVDQNSNGSGS